MKSKAIKLISAGILLIIAAGTLIYRLSVREEVPGTESFFGMDTIMTVSAYGEGAEEAILRAKDRIGELEKKLSVTIADSEVSKINGAGGSRVKVSEDMVYITKAALEFSKETDGAFDITLYPVSRLWGFTGGEYRVPGEREIEEALALTGYSVISLDTDRGEIGVPAGTMLDYGAIAKGFAGDETVRILREAGMGSAIINLGGSISLIGSKPGDKPWKIAVRASEGNESAGTLSLRNCSVVTSGRHERFFKGEDGTEYCHIIDPATGRPVVSDLDSITVITDSAMKGDALSTAFFVMGKEKAAEYWRLTDDVEFVAVSGKLVYVTEGIRDLFSASEGYKTVVIDR